MAFLKRDYLQENLEKTQDTVKIFQRVWIPSEWPTHEEEAEESCKSEASVTPVTFLPLPACPTIR